MLTLLLLLACAPPQHQACYHPLEATEGVPLEGAVLEVEWCSGELCSPVYWWRDDETLYVSQVGRLADARPLVCVWRGDGDE